MLKPRAKNTEAEHALIYWGLSTIHYRGGSGTTVSRLMQNINMLMGMGPSPMLMERAKVLLDKVIRGGRKPKKGPPASISYLHATTHPMHLPDSIVDGVCIGYKTVQTRNQA